MCRDAPVRHFTIANMSSMIFERSMPLNVSAFSSWTMTLWWACSGTHTCPNVPVCQNTPKCPEEKPSSPAADNKAFTTFSLLGCVCFWLCAQRFHGFPHPFWKAQWWLELWPLSQNRTQPACADFPPMPTSTINQKFTCVCKYPTLLIWLLFYCWLWSYETVIQMKHFMIVNHKPATSFWGKRQNDNIFWFTFLSHH